MKIEIFKRRTCMALLESTNTILSQLTDDERRNFESLFARVPPEAEEKYARQIAAALGGADEVAIKTGKDGAAFELSRAATTIQQGFEIVDFTVKAPKVSFLGHRRRGKPSEKPDVQHVDTPIELDIPIIRSSSGKVYVYEVKCCRRKYYGNRPEYRNQLLKYQAAIDQGLIDGATIEIKGRLYAGLLDWAKTYAPNVEIIYALDLPSGAEYRFVLKAAENGNGLRFVNAEIAPANEKIVEGIKKAIADGRIFDIIVNTPIQGASEELAPFIDRPGYITSLTLLEEFVERWKESIYRALIELS